MENQTITTDTTQQIIPKDISISPTTVITNQTTNRVQNTNEDPNIRKRNSLIYYLTLGIRGLLSSRKGTLSLILLACVTTLCAFKLVDGTAYAAVATVISSIFCWTQSSTDRAAINSPNCPTPYPQIPPPSPDTTQVMPSPNPATDPTQPPVMP